MYRLVGARGFGSAIVEAALDLTGLAYDVETLDFGAPGADRDRLAALNPLVEVPVLILPDGAVLTESAAMILHLADRAPHAGLAPAPEDPARPAFLRWLVFIVANIYPTFTYGDHPGRWLADPKAAAALRVATDARVQELWRLVEGAITPDPWFLGRTFSALDLYVAVMTRWRPRRDWFAAKCPKLADLAERVHHHGPLRPTWARHFDPA